MENFQLDERLKKVAELIPSSASWGDIGTDHGYLLIELVKRGKVQKAIGCDLRENPLASARKNVRWSGLGKEIELRLGDGLTPLKPYEVNGVSFCGMGGGTIQKILLDNPEVWNSLEYLLCQPQSDSGELRKFLADSGWKLVEEVWAESQGRLYELFLAEKGLMKRPEKEIIWELGPLAFEKKDPLIAKRIAEILVSVTQILMGLEKAVKSEENEQKKQFWQQKKSELEEVWQWL